jgi:hypothetical protein
MYGGFATTAWNFVAKTFLSAARTSDRVTELHGGRRLVALDLLEAVRPVHVRVKARCVSERRHARELGCSHDEARTSEGARVVVEVDAHHAIEGMRDDLGAIPVGVYRGSRPHEPLQPVNEKVSRATRRIEKTNLVGTEGLDRGRQRAIEDERAHEVGRLTEREAVLHDRIELLVQVAHQLALEALLGKAPQRTRVGITVAPEGDQRSGQLVGRRGNLGGLRAEQLGNATVMACEISVDPSQECGLSEVWREAFEELLCLEVEQAAGAQEPAILEYADIDRLQNPQDRGSSREQVRPNFEVFGDSLVGVKLHRAFAHRARRAHSRPEVGGDLRDVLAEGVGESGSVGLFHRSFSPEERSREEASRPRGATWRPPR